MQQTLLLIASFTIMLLMAGAYYIASLLLSPPRRKEGKESSIYASGEAWTPMEEAEPPYVWALLIFACIDALPLIVILKRSFESILLLIVALSLALLVIHEVQKD